MRKITLLEPLPDRELYMQYAGPFMTLYKQTIEEAKSPDTEITELSCPPGFWKGPSTVVDYFMNALAVPPICKGAIEAEKAGADAAIIVCTDDPGLRFARQLVDIPVIGEFESTIHLASMMGHKFGVLAWPTRPFMARTEMKIRMYGLEAKAIPNPVEPVIEPGPTAERTLVLEGYTDPEAFVKKYYIPAAQRLVKRGAEVIVMDSTGVSLIAARGGFKKLEDIGIPVKVKTAAVPILNVVAVSMKMAELMVDLHRIGIPPVSRVGLYQKTGDIVKKEELAQIREYFEKDWKTLPLPQHDKKHDKKKK